ncbi:nudix hydrolase 1 [Parachlamydia acanthamoebae UV-7]|uniref:Nudix hydrolase 1 n=2 Tax=Parachlamydia acanthamoebae TaxID=83552 RepID=F8L0H1_PARAV|nr:NUDIX domain-containing protein [Parachlamydia acanthamoebae]CCB86710.1 nudix hydrolase 1 [Parachlamydia acanthamoebae UV-7]
MDNVDEQILDINELQNFKKRPLIGVAVVVFKNNKVLLGKRKNSHEEGKWAFPGGHLEFGESVEGCASRELMEEVGLQAISLKIGPWVENIMDAGKKHYITLFVFVDSFSGEPQLLEPDKCEGWEWFEWENLPSPIFPTIITLKNKISISDLTNEA